jgi:hypothetical protein
MSNGSGSPTQQEVAQAEERAKYWENLKKEAEARAAIGRAEDNARISVLKAELDYLKAALPAAPDPSKYKPGAPTAATLVATAGRMTFAEANKLATDLAAKLAEALPKGTKRAILPEDARTRTLIGLSRAVRKALDQAIDRLEMDRKDLATPAESQQESVAAGAMAVAGPVFSAASDIVLSLVSMLRAQYAFATASQTSLADGVFRSILNQELKDNDFEVIDPDFIVVDLSASDRPELQKLDTVHKGIAKLREAIAKISAEIETLRRQAAKENDEPKKKELQRQADVLEAKVKQATVTVEEVYKLIAGFNTADAQGNTALESALRGGMLADKLTDAAFFLSVKALASDVDTVAVQRFFFPLYLALSSHTVVQWRATSAAGLVVSSGALRSATAFWKPSLPGRLFTRSRTDPEPPT